jgi:1-phosphofructokinase
MIITLTGNLLAERTLEYSSWAPGKTQRAVRESFQVGGKGINVSKMLTRMGSPTTAWCFGGGAAGDECAQWLKQKGIPFRSFRSEVPTRTGVVVRAAEQPETTFLAPDRVPDAAALAACAAALDECRQLDAILAVCGSFPGWMSAPAEPLRNAVASWAQSGRLYCDSYGPPLEWAIGHKARLVKINRDEFDGLFAEPERRVSLHDRLQAARQRWQVEAWIITDGPREIWCADGRDSPRVFQPPKVHEVSPTGSGDVFFACVLHALTQMKVNLAEAVAYAIPFAAANAAHPGVAEFDLNLLNTNRSVHP